MNARLPLFSCWVTMVYLIPCTTTPNALYLATQALSAGGLVDPTRHSRTPLEAALATEQHLHAWASAAPAPPPTGAKGGKAPKSDPSSSSSYTRRSYLLWGLLAPDSDGYSVELRELVLSGTVGTEALVRMDLVSGAGVA